MPLDSIEIPMDEQADQRDPGAPREYSNDPVDQETAKSADQSRIEALEKDVEAARREARERADSERYWAEKARTAERNQPQADEEDEEDEPTPRRAAAKDDDNPDELLEDLSKEGLKGLLKRGVITEDQLEAELDKRVLAIEQRLEARLQNTNQAQQFDSAIKEDFPEVYADGKKMQAWLDGGRKGDQPEMGDHYQAAANLYREMMADNPDADIKASRAMFKAAVKAANKQVDGSRKVQQRNSQEDDRSERIAAQRGERRRSGGTDDVDLGGRTFSRQAQEVMKHLGVKPEDYGKHQDRRARRASN
jgi:hypothetical protein